MYTAAVLSEISANLLKWIVRASTTLEKDGFRFCTANGVLPHHMTINLGELDASLNSPTILDQDVTLSFQEIYFDYTLGVCAAKIIEAKLQDGYPIYSNNDVPHVTACMKPDSKPKFSNKLFLTSQHTEKVKLDQVYHLDARVKIVL